MPVHSHSVPAGCRAVRAHAGFLLAGGALLAIFTAADTSRAAIAAPFSQNNVPLASLASQVTYTVDFSTLPLRPNLIVEAIPESLAVNATSDDGHVMGFRHKTLPIHGVQFHPESIATEHGHAMLANFLEICGIEAKALI